MSLLPSDVADVVVAEIEAPEEGRIAEDPDLVPARRRGDVVMAELQHREAGTASETGRVNVVLVERQEVEHQRDLLRSWIPERVPFDFLRSRVQVLHIQFTQSGEPLLTKHVRFQGVYVAVVQIQNPQSWKTNSSPQGADAVFSQHQKRQMRKKGTVSPACHRKRFQSR